VNVILGPVVGHVTDTTARILLETDKATTIRLDAKTAAHPPVSVEAAAKGKGFPTVFELKGLKPGTAYSVSIEGATPPPVQTATFKTISARSEGPTRIAIISCNKVFFDSTGHADLWDDLAKRAKNGEIDMVLHIGDQVYADSDFYFVEDTSGPANLRTSKSGYEGDADAAVSSRDKHKDHSAYYTALNSIKDLPPEEWDSHRTDILEIYRAVYRSTWGKYSTAMALASVPNYMVLDDHEITDDWGDEEEHKQIKTLNSPVNFVANCGWQVWNEYQAQLWQDVPDLRTGLQRAHIFHKVHDIGIAIVDVRASKTFLRAPGKISRPYLGDEQWAEFESALAPGGLYDDVRNLIVCSPVPVAFMSPKTTKALARTVADDMIGLWTGNGELELPHLLDLLWKWKTTKKHREVTIAAGDIHIGVQTTIFRDNLPAFHQVTASAIHNSTLGNAVLEVINLASSGSLLGNPCFLCKSAGAKWGFTHEYLTQGNNYAIVEINKPEDGCESPVMCKLVEDVKVGQGKPNEAKVISQQSSNLDPGVKTKSGGCQCSLQ